MFQIIKKGYFKIKCIGGAQNCLKINFCFEMLQLLCENKIFAPISWIQS